MKIVIGAILLAGQPLCAQSPDTGLYTPKMEVLFGVSNIVVKRAVAQPGLNNSYGNATLRGVELSVMGAQGGGVRGRFETGSIAGGQLVPAAGKVESLVATLVMGKPEFALLGGYRMTTIVYNGERRFYMPELGFEGGKHFAGAGTLVKAAVTYRRTIADAKGDSVRVSGLEARTSVLYVPPRLPLYIELGYRRDVANVIRPSNAIARREETSAVILSLGLQTGLSVR